MRRATAPLQGDGPTEPDRGAVVATTVVVVLAVAMFVHLLVLGRGRTFFFDEWDFVQHRSSGGLDTLLEPHNEHVTVIPVLIYRFLFETVGLDPVWPFRVPTALAHVSAAVVVYDLTRRRIDDLTGVLAAVLVLSLGMGWQISLWGFPINLMLPVLCGLVAWAALDRHTRRGDVVACAALTVAVLSSAVGVPICIGVAVELAVARAWRRWWVVVIPVAVIAGWSLTYGRNTITGRGVVRAPQWAAEAAAAAAGSLFGQRPLWGVPVLVLVAVAVVMSVATGRGTPRLFGLLATGGSYWLLTGLARSAGPTPVPPDTSRYLVLGAVVVLLVAVEVARGMRPPRVATVAMIGLTVVAAIAGLDALGAGADDLQGHSRTVEAHLAATALLGASMPADAHPSPTVAPQVRAGDYLAVVSAFGESPIGDPDATLAALEPDERARADEVVSQYGLAMAPALWPVAGCHPVTGDPLAVPDGGAVTIHAGTSPVEVRARWFADTFAAPPVTALPPGTTLTVSSAPLGHAWHAQLTSPEPFQACVAAGPSSG